MTSEIPDVIYLQIGDGCEADEIGSVDWSEVSWCRDGIFDNDIEYVRADRLPRYADHPANGDKAGKPFVPDRDDCYIVVIPGGSVFSARPRFIDGVWLSCPQHGNLPFNAPLLFFATREAAQQYADEPKLLAELERAYAEIDRLKKGLK